MAYLSSEDVRDAQALIHVAYSASGPTDFADRTVQELSRLVPGEVVAVYIDKSLIEDGVYNTALARPILRAGRGGDYLEVKTENMFEMKRPAGSSKPEFHGS